MRRNGPLPSLRISANVSFAPPSHLNCGLSCGPRDPLAGPPSVGGPSVKVAEPAPVLSATNPQIVYVPNDCGVYVYVSLYGPAGIAVPFPPSAELHACPVVSTYTINCEANCVAPLTTTETCFPMVGGANAKATEPLGRLAMNEIGRAHV